LATAASRGSRPHVEKGSRTARVRLAVQREGHEDDERPEGRGDQD